MAVTEEESFSASSSCSSPAASCSSSGASCSTESPRSLSGAAYCLVKCILPSSVILHVVHGHFRSPTSYDIVLGKETSIELAVMGEDGIVQSVCEQPVFGTIKDMASLPWNNKSRAQNPQIPQKDLLVVTSDSGKLSFLSFCNEMHRFFAVTHIQLSEPGNSIHQIGRMLAVDSSGCYIAVSAYAERLALFSVLTDNGSILVDKRTIYPHGADQEAMIGDLIKGFRRACPLGTIWSISFISTIPGKSTEEDYVVLAIILNRRGSSRNELLLLGWNVKENVMHILSKYVEEEHLAHTIVEVPQSHGFALLFRVGDVLVMDLRDIRKPTCAQKINLSAPVPVVEEQSHHTEDPFRMHDGDDEGFIAASALLELQDHAMVFHENDDPMNIDSHAGDVKSIPRYMCSWCWEPGKKSSARMIFCVDTGELFMVEIFFGHDGIEVNICDCVYEGLPCKALLWVEGGFLTAIMEMGDGVVLKLEEGILAYASPIQNISPILDMSALDFHNEKQEQVFASCGVSPEGSMRIIRSGISVERLLKTACVYKGVTGIWAVKMHVIDSHHSFVVLSFVEETRILSVGLSFTDVSEYVGFLQDTCTLACGLVADGLLVQIHQTAVRLCLPTSRAHSDGVNMSSPLCTVWSPENTGISLGSVAHNLIVVATSNPCFLIILGIQTSSYHVHELCELHRIRLYSELSCISIPQKPLFRKESSSLDVSISDRALPLPVGVDSSKIFVIGTHKPSVEILSYSPSLGIQVIAVGTISLTNAVGITITGCVPQDARLVLADNLYVLCGLRNGMLLRFEWPTDSSKTSNYETPFDHFSVHKGITLSKVPVLGYSVSGGTCGERTKEPVPSCLQLIALRRIGITPVFLVPLNDNPDADIIALSSRPWLVQTARHGLSYISISFQPSTHVTPVCSAECPKGLLFVSESALNLVEMVNSRRLNVQKFHLGGTPRKVVYHHDSRSLLVLRTDLGGDLYSSDICCVDPVSGAVLSSFKFELGETGKCMELVRVGDGQVVVVGTSLSCGPSVMPSGEAESTKGRLIVLCVEHWPTPHRSLSFNDQDTTEPIADHMPNTSPENGSDDDTIGEVRLQQDGESWQLRLAFSTTWPGAVLSLSCYLDRYFLASSGNAFYVCGFPSSHPQRVKRFAVARTRFVIVSLKACATRILVGDCRDGVLFYSYHEDTKKLEQLYCDPEQRLVSDCHLINADTAIVSDRKGSIAVMTSCGLSEEDNVSPECNLALNCSYYLGDIAVSLRKGPFSYKLSDEDASIDSDLSHDNIMAGTLLGCIIAFIPMVRDEYELLKVVQAKLAAHPLTAPVLGNNHSEFRGRQCQAGVRQMLDGDMLAQFLELTSIQQDAVLASDCARSEMPSSSWTSFRYIPVSQVVTILERIHYATS